MFDIILGWVDITSGLMVNLKQEFPFWPVYHCFSSHQREEPFDKHKET